MRLLILVLMFLVSTIFAIDITKVGIVDFNKVGTSLLNSQIKSDIEKLKDQYQKKIDSLNLEIQELKKQYDEAIKIKDFNSARMLGNNYNLKVSDLNKTFNLAKINFDEQKKISLNNLNSNSAIWDQILKAIQYIAESNGISLVIKKDSPYILYYNSLIDITDSVISHLSKIN